jgi:hypothetical protein
MIRSAIIQSSNYIPFRAQCGPSASGNQDQSPGTPKIEIGFGKKRRKSGLADNPTAREVESWRAFATAYVWTIIGFYLYCVVKYVLIYLIAPGSLLDELQWVDCFLLGRYKYVGRTNKVSGQIIIVVHAFLCTGRLLVIMIKPKFKFYACEFLMQNRNVVASNKRVARATESVRTGFSGGASRSSKTLAGSKIDHLFYLKNRFDPYDDEWILRPNRTMPSWLALNRALRRIAVFMFVAIIGWNVMFFYFSLGSILTNLGFEMSYPACMHWLRDKQANGSQAYDYIYVAPKVLVGEMQLKDLPARIPITFESSLKQASPYNALRISLDFIENLLIYTELGLTLAGIATLLLINAVDIIINASAIRQRLVDLIDQMKEFEQSNLFEIHSPAEPSRAVMSYETGEMKSVAAEHWQFIKRFSRELDRTQAILTDHFELTLAYNLFASVWYVFLFGLWFCYTAVVSIWTSSIRSPEAEYEFVVSQLIAAITVTVYLSISAIVRSYNSRLYPLVSQIAANNFVHWDTKQRWVMTTNFFYPKSLYCMTLFNSSEISWLFNLKVSRDEQTTS